jgi:hypothetical protein
VTSHKNFNVIAATVRTFGGYWERGDHDDISTSKAEGGG